MLARQPRKLILLNIAPGKTIAAMSPLTWSIWSTSNINAVMCILHLFITYYLWYMLGLATKVCA